MKTIRFALLSLSLFGVTACAAPTISGEAAHALVQKKSAVLLDVRTPEEFADKHLEGALNVPVAELEGRLASLDLKKD